MNTKRRYQTEPYLASSTAHITAIDVVSGHQVLCLDETIFFPTGGGQPCDTGSIGGYPVCDVYEREGEIFHALGKDCTLSIGDEVEISIDWDRRFDHMQRHCGEHILSGAFADLYGGANRGFHMGQDYITIDIALETPGGNPAPDGRITWEMAKAAELYANQSIWADLPVTVYHFDRRDQVDDLPLRKALAFDEDIFIVYIGTPKRVVDCVACCGTHPSTTGQVGMIKIDRLETHKGMTRVFFEAGSRAFRKYQDQLDVLHQLGNQLSAGPEDLLDKYTARQKKDRQIRDDLYHLKRWVIDREIEEISQALTPAFARFYDQLSAEDLLEIGRALAGQIPTVLFLVHRPTNTVFLFTDKFDAGKLVKENASLYQGKGGGNKNSARAIFPKAEYVDVFLDLIEKHLR